MINEEKIKAATDVVFADVLSPKANICMSAGFIRGIECSRRLFGMMQARNQRKTSVSSPNFETMG